MVGVWLDILLRILLNGDYQYRFDELRSCVNAMLSEGTLDPTFVPTAKDIVELFDQM